MLLLTRIRYGVEHIDRPRVAESYMLGPYGYPTDWLWPLRIERTDSSSTFKLEDNTWRIVPNNVPEYHVLEEYKIAKQLAKKRDLANFVKRESK